MTKNLLEGITWHAQGEANFYRLMRDGNWLAVIQIYGELLVCQQEEILRSMLSTPSGTPAMPVKAYYHEVPNEYGGLNKSVGLEVRKQFTDAPLVLEADARARIACLEGEIAKRDARIVELEARYQRDVYGLNNEGDPIGGDPAGGYANDNARLRSELAAIKAQGVVMPEPMKRGDEGGSGEYGAAMIRGYNACLREVARLNAAPVQQVSVPDGWRELAKRADDFLYSLPETDGVLRLRADLCSMLAAPAAPAADALLVEALDYQVLFDAIAAATSVYANGAVNISVQAFRDALAANRAKGVV